MPVKQGAAIAGGTCVPMIMTFLSNSKFAAGKHRLVACHSTDAHMVGFAAQEILYSIGTQESSPSCHRARPPSGTRNILNVTLYHHPPA
jgi:hypothetical protein